MICRICLIASLIADRGRGGWAKVANLLPSGVWAPHLRRAAPQSARPNITAARQAAPYTAVSLR